MAKKKTTKKKAAAKKTTTKRGASKKATSKKKTAKKKAVSSKKTTKKAAVSKKSPATTSRKTASAATRHKSTAAGAATPATSSAQSKKKRRVLFAPPASRTEPEHREPLTDAQLRKVKTGLSKKDIQHYRDLLLQKRAEIIGDVLSMEGDARNNNGGNLSHMPMHMADIGSDNYEQEFTLGLVESERKLLRLIEEAIMRIENKTYGVCIESGVPIGKPRLDAKPWAKYCIEVVREKERRGEM